uniref:uncharacterized protein C2orf72 homolog n=1 Tax=Jaculus jaculus TaxID=51337 RepID=UPI001E1B4053|nr:uncharacterized protein C2orf72 homolog [Jaculus jaculus]
MDPELEALAPGPASPAEPPFRALVEAAGGRGQVLLVGELWEREQSRALLRDFARAVFPCEPKPEHRDPDPEPEPEPEPAAAGARSSAAAGAARAIRSALVFVLCRASSLAAREPRRRLREMLRDVRGRRRAGAALVGVLVSEAAGPEDAATTPGLRRLDALLRAVFGRQVGGPVQAAAYCPGQPASSLDVQAAACRALQASGPGSAEDAWERPGLPGLLACFSWGHWSQRKDRDVTSSRGPVQKQFQDLEEELALTAVFPNGDCDDHRCGSGAQDGAICKPPEPTEDTR